MKTTYYNFFDTRLCFQTNRTDIQEEFSGIYGKFEDKNPPAPAAGPLDKRHRLFYEGISCSITESGHTYKITAKSSRYSIEYTIKGRLHPDVFLSLFTPVIYEVKDYFLIHGGNLAAKNNKNLIISAPCGFGKTTLTMELLKNGFGFLSDELAPLNRKTGLVHPYPRGIGVLTKTEKNIISPFKHIDTPRKPAYVIFITLRKDKEPNDDTRYTELALARFDENVFRQLDALPEIDEITIVKDRLFPVFRLRAAKQAHITPKIENICALNGVPIMYTLKGKTYPPDYDAEPELNKISQKDGVFELSQNILNVHNSALFFEVFGGSRPKMIFDLAGLMNKADFYTITAGKLDKMVQLVKEITA